MALEKVCRVDKLRDEDLSLILTANKGLTVQMAGAHTELNQKTKKALRKYTEKRRMKDCETNHRDTSTIGKISNNSSMLNTNFEFSLERITRTKSKYVCH